MSSKAQTREKDYERGIRIADRRKEIGLSQDELGCNPNAHDIGERIFCIKTMSLYAYPVIFLYSHWYEGSDN